MGNLFLYIYRLLKKQRVIFIILLTVVISITAYFALTSSQAQRHIDLTADERSFCLRNVVSPKSRLACLSED